MQMYKILIFSCIAILFSFTAVSGEFYFFESNNHSKLLSISNTFIDTPAPDIKELQLSQKVVFTNCVENQARCSINNEKIEIRTEVNKPEETIKFYDYKVTVGKIIGKGKQVVWDLTGVESGEYKISVGINDGCGICGAYETRTVYVVECPKISGDGFPPGTIYSLKVDKAEIFEFCSLVSESNQMFCSNEKNKVNVTTSANVEDEHKAIFKYDVTGGRIIGNGANVEWDLSKAEPGTYVVTANVDVGYGFCSESKSTIVKVVECTKCKKQK